MLELPSRLKVELLALRGVAKMSADYLPETPRRAPGRPTPDKDSLSGIRDDLVHLLSVWWADIGWHLRHTKSREELRRAFEPLRGKNNNPLIERFLRTTALATTGKELRFTRKALGKAVKRRYEAQSNCSDPLKMFREAETGMMQARAGQLGKFRRELLKRQSRLLEDSKELRAAEELEQTLEKQLSEQEVGFAQDQLVRILGEGRCACNPLRLANAMAGLLFLTARVSYNRCSKIKCTVWPNFDFQVFEKIESIWNSRRRYHYLSIVELYRQEIKKLPRTMRRNEAENYLRTRLAEHFGSLKLAIEKSLESGVDSEQIPFLITSCFNENREAPSTALSSTLAASERID